MGNLWIDVARAAMTDPAARPVVGNDIRELPKLLDRRKKDRLKGIALVMPGVLWLFVFAVLPLGFLILLSFWKSTLFGLSTTFTFDNYRSIASSSGYMTVLWHTLMIS